MPAIPPGLTKFFWDVSPETLDAQKHARFILERLLEMGDDAALRWLLANYSRETVRETVCLSRRLSRKTARFWQAFFDLKEEEIRCLTPSCPRERNPLWPY